MSWGEVRLGLATQPSPPPSPTPAAPPCGGEVGGWVVFRKVIAWEGEVGVGCTGRAGEGVVGGSVWGKRWSCSRRGLGGWVEEALGWKSWWEVGGWVVFRKVRLWEAPAAELGLSGAGISKLGLS